jgi:acetolactate decarboxylase
MKRTRRRSYRPLLPVLLGLSALVAFGPAALSAPAPKPATVFQFSTLPALSSGRYEGEMTFGDLLKHGDFGLGTFDALDGEMILLNGRAWQVHADGRVAPVDKKATTPFAVVTRFSPDQTVKVAQAADYAALKKQIGLLLPTSNVPYAIEVSGTFSRLKIRSVPGQAKPYPPLAEVVKTQSVWEWQNVRGTLAGFWFPSYMSGVNLADLHFHFLSDDKKQGGHMLDCELKEGTIRIQSLRGFEMQLPTNSSFDQANLTADQSATLKATEQAGAK